MRTHMPENSASAGPLSGGRTQSPPTFQLQAAPVQLSPEDPRSLTKCLVIEQLGEAEVREELGRLEMWTAKNPKHPQLDYYRQLIYTFSDRLRELEKKPAEEPRSIKKCLVVEQLDDVELEREIGLLQRWIEANPSHADLHYYISLVTGFRDTLRERKGIEQDPEEVTAKDYDKMYRANNKKVDGKWKAKPLSVRKKNIKKLQSPTGHQAGKGGWLESNADNNAMFDAYFGSVLPTGIAVDDLKVLSSDFTAHNPDYKELPPPDLWPQMKKSLELIRKIEAESGLTFKVASAYRSYRVNSHAGGANGSSHMQFLGLDLLPQGDKRKNASFLKYFYVTAGMKENMGLGFYSTSRQHIDASSHRSWGGTWKKDSRNKKALRKAFVKDWGEAKAKKLDQW